MKKAFSLLELIFVIVIIGIIASFAVPKYMDTKNYALASTIKRDLTSTISAIQTHFLIHKKVENIEDVVSLNKSNWTVSKKEISFKEADEICLKLSIDKTKIKIEVFKDVGKVCKLLDEMEVKTQNIDLI